VRTCDPRNPPVSRRAFLRATAAAAAGLVLAPRGFGQATPAEGELVYKFVNRTNGKFADAECFWSLDSGKNWHSFAQEPTAPCPRGNGRVYFRLGAAPKNLNDREAIWDFIEYAHRNPDSWSGNTTQVDAFCIPITIELGEKKAGITESRRKLFETFRKEAPEPFKACVKGDFWIVSPCSAGFGKKGPYANYFDAYIDEVWALYAQEKKTPSGKWTGKVVDGAMTFTPVAGGKSFSCARKPTTQDAFMGTGVLATNPRFCAAINRHVLADPADWDSPAAFYKAEPYNWYAKFLHEHGIGNKAYGFCYDDDANQAAFFSGKGKELIVTLYWDSEAARK